MGREAPRDATVRLEGPEGCTEGERRQFERLVRRGFGGSDQTLPERVRAARLLAFRYGADDELVAIAGLKDPGAGYRRSVFARAGATADPAAHELELGWVFVVPACRGRRIGQSLCRSLLDAEPDSGVFATTRPDNAPMIRTLVALGFERTGRPFPHSRHDQELLLFLGPQPPRPPEERTSSRAGHR